MNKKVVPFVVTCSHWMLVAYLGLLLLMTPALLTSPAPFPSSDTQPTSLDKDPRLDRIVNITETGIPLEELLHKIGDRTLSLSCDRSCASQKVQVRLKRRPLRALMKALAEWLPGTWKPLEGNKGYRLKMAEDAVARRQRWWRLFQGERERALAAQRAHILRKMQAEPYRRKPGDVNPESSDLQIEEQSAAQHDFFRTLPFALQERIANQINTNVLYALGPTFFGTQDEEGATLVAVRDLPGRPRTGYAGESLAFS